MDDAATLGGDTQVDARLRDLAIEAERALLSPAVRGDAAALERMLDERFTEIGQSGRLYTRAAIIAVLVAESADSTAREAPGTRQMTEVRIESLAPDTLLLTYLLQFDGRCSRRASIWRVGSDGHGRAETRLLFHQGTAVNPT